MTGLRPDGYGGVARLLSLLRSAGAPSLVLAQVINIAVIALPIASHRLAQTAALVLVAAMATIVVYTVTLGFSSVYPGVSNATEGRSLLRFALAAIASASVLAAASAPFLGYQGLSAELAVSLAGMIFGQGVYVISTTVLIRRGDLLRFGRVRIFSALTNLVATLAAIAFPGAVYGLVYATTISNLTGAAIALQGSWTLLGGLIRPLRGTPAPTLRRYWRAGLSSLLGGLATQSSSLGVGLAPASAQLWAVNMRIAGGFAGTSLQVLAPSFDMRFAASLQSGDPVRGARIRNGALAGGAAVFVASAFLTSIAIVTLPAAAIEEAGLLPAIAVTLTYSFGLLLPSVAGKFLMMRGGQAAQLVWVLAKLAATAAAFVFLRDFRLLAGLAIVEGMAAVSYCLILVLDQSHVTKETSGGVRGDLTERSGS